MHGYQKLLLCGLVASLPCVTLASVACGIVGATDSAVPAGAVSVTHYEELTAALSAGEKNVCLPEGTTIVMPFKARAVVIGADSVLSTCDYQAGMKKAVLTLEPVPESTPAPPAFPMIVLGARSTMAHLVVAGVWRNSAQNSTQNLTIGVQTQQLSSGQRFFNNDMYGWPNAAISVQATTDVHVHHNYIHDNYWPWGYGVNVSGSNANGANALIECNVFDNNRHSVASAGNIQDSYVYKNNIQLSRSLRHAVDIHESSVTPKVAGKMIDVQDNYFLNGGTYWGHTPSVVVRGEPVDGPARINGNFFKSELSFTSGTGPQYAVYGSLANSIPDTETLKANNQFGVKFSTIRVSPDECRIKANGVDERMTCDAVPTKTP